MHHIVELTYPDSVKSSDLKQVRSAWRQPSHDAVQVPPLVHLPTRIVRGHHLDRELRHRSTTIVFWICCFKKKKKNNTCNKFVF